MDYLYLRISFQELLRDAKNYPKISLVKLENWDGKKGDYQNGNWTCYESYLNHVKHKDGVYTYSMVIHAKEDDFSTINSSVQTAFKKVKEYIKIQNQERNLIFSRYQEFLDKGGFPIYQNK